MVRVLNLPRGPLMVALLLTLVGAAAFIASGWHARTGVGSDRPVHYSPDPAVPRIGFHGDPVDAMLVVDFDILDDELYLLDVAASQVIVLGDSSGHLRTVRSFGRRGRGPGELMAPSGIALLPLSGEIVVADRSALHYFSRVGDYLRTRTPKVPCLLSQPRVAEAGNALMLSGRCLHGDSVVAELFWLADPDGMTQDSAVRVTSEPLYTMNGGGATLAASSFYSSGSGRGLFGGGGSACITRIGLQARPPSAERLCAIASSTYAFVPDAELVARSRALAAARPWAAKSFELPDRLPVHVGSMRWNDMDVLLRPVTADSIVFRIAGDEADLAVAGFNDLVGCRPTGCLWLRHDDAPQVMFVPAERILARGSRR